ncbi:hypothetical protein RirG_165200 [Rhizophagus irregularis DAOM 197198w]|uniref:Uncharacterized protein n=2 Tax=Rhizophagus irregularis TaxID=588596 RepID=A0A015KQM3_RHIIW|nr:hypothetical protein RirG_165200 [Rhizophagus irregularis DAOM 197198w]
MFTTEFETITVSSQSSRRSSVTSLSDQDYQDADEFALRECIEIIEANVEEVIIDKADEREKKWWIDGNYKIIGENTRLPLILVEDLVLLLQDVDPGDLFSKQSDASYTPKQLPKPAANSCDAQGNPWPTVIVEIANTQSLPSIIRKTTQFWLAPNRVEDVIILKLWNWNSRRDQNGIPLRCLTVQYYFLMSFHLFHSPNNYPVYSDSAINSVIEEALKMHVEITYQFKQFNLELLMEEINHITDALVRECVL